MPDIVRVATGLAGMPEAVRAATGLAGMPEAVREDVLIVVEL